MFLYAITDSRRLASDLRERTSALQQLAEQWALGGVDAIQIREKDLEAGELETVTAQVLKVVAGSQTHVFVNGRVDVAIACGAEVHLAGGSLRPREVERVFAAAGMSEPQISVACHSVAEAEEAAKDGATIALLAPIFGKQIVGEASLPGLGLDILRQACASAPALPVVALGGVSAENAHQCVEAGAAGVAGIRLFSGDEWRSIR